MQIQIYFWPRYCAHNLANIIQIYFSQGFAWPRYCAHNLANMIRRWRQQSNNMDLQYSVAGVGPWAGFGAAVTRKLGASGDLSAPRD